MGKIVCMSLYTFESLQFSRMKVSPKWIAIFLTKLSPFELSAIFHCHWHSYALNCISYNYDVIICIMQEFANVTLTINNIPANGNIYRERDTVQ